MPTFSKASIDRLMTCDIRLQDLFLEVIQHTDCIVLCGKRDEHDQNAAVALGTSKKPFPTSKHNSSPSMAIDVMPYPIDWKNRERICYFAGIVMGIAIKKGISLRWGGDFNENFDPKDEEFVDMPHFEIMEDK